MDSDAVRRYRLNVHNLARRLPPGSVTAAAGAIGLQDTPPGNAAVGVAARVNDLGRSLVQTWSRRGSPYVVPAEDLDVFTRGLLPRDDDGRRVVLAGLTPVLDDLGMTASDAVQRASAGVTEVLAHRQLTKRELGLALAPFFPATFARWFEPERFSSFTALLARAVALEGSFLFAPRQGAEATFVRTDRWLGAAPKLRADEDARRELLRRYLRCYGPSTADAFADWAGIDRADAAWSWGLLASELAETADGIVLKSETTRRRPAEPIGVRLLPAYDAYLAGVDRLTIAPDTRTHRLIWRATGNPGVVLADGHILGTWRPKKAGRRLDVNVVPFRRLGKPTLQQVDEEAAIVARARGADDVKVLLNTE